MPPLLDAPAVLENFVAADGDVWAGRSGSGRRQRTGKLLIMKEGAVEVVRGGMRIAEIAEPGAVFGDLAALLDQPHSADVRALAPSTFYVADGRTILRVDPIATLYVAVVLAQASRPSTISWSRRKATGAGRSARHLMRETLENIGHCAVRCRSTRQKHSTIVARLDEPEGMPPQQSRQRRRRLIRLGRLEPRLAEEWEAHG